MLRIIWVRAPIITLVVIVGVLVGFGVGKLGPDKYHGLVVLELAAPSSMSIFGDGVAGSFLENPWSLAQHTQAMKSGEILGEVVDKLQLVKRWGTRGRSEAIEQVRRGLTIQSWGHTDLTYLLFRGTNSAEVAAIANTTVSTFLDRLESNSREAGRSRLKALEAEAEGLRAGVQSKYKETSRLRAELQVNYGEGDGGFSNKGKPGGKSAVTQAAEEEAQARQSYGDAKALAETLSSLDSGGLASAAVLLGVGGPDTAAVWERAKDSEARLSEILAAGLGSNHPVVRGMVARRDAYAAEFASHAQALARAVGAKLNQASSRIEASERRSSEVRAAHDQRRLELATFFQAEEEYARSKLLLDKVDSAVRELTMQINMPQNRGRVWEWAEATGTRTNLDIGTLVLLGGVVGLILGTGLAFGLEYLDTSPKTVEEVEEVSQSTILCAVPYGANLIATGGGGGVEGEPWQMLKLGLDHGGFREQGVVLAVTSAMEGEGKSSSAGNIACTYANSGFRVLLIDADLRKPTQHRIFGKKRRGEGGLLSWTVSTHIPRLDLIPAGEPCEDPEAELCLHLKDGLLQEARQKYDLVILDCPPVLGLGDTLILTNSADLTILTVHYRRYPAAVLRLACDSIRRAGGKIAGIVLNRVDIRRDDYFTYYGGDPQYYSRVLAKSGIIC